MEEDLEDLLLLEGEAAVRLLIAPAPDVGVPDHAPVVEAGVEMVRHLSLQETRQQQFHLEPTEKHEDGLTLMLLVANLAIKKPAKMTETLAHGYSSESMERELSYEYQHDRA